MTQMILRSRGNISINDLITEALKAEENELLTAILKTKEHLLKFEDKYQLSTDEFISGSTPSFEIDDMDAVEWSGEYETLKRIEEKLNNLREIEICS